MKHRLVLYTFAIVATIIMATGCMEKRAQTSKERSRGALLKDTVYTQQAAMNVYGYQPMQALQIIDSAVIVGNLTEVWGDLNRARIYSQTHMEEQLDSAFGWTDKQRLDTARAIGERLLQHDSAKASLTLRQNILEILVYTARRQQNIEQVLLRSRQLVEVWREQKAETEALRTEAELGAALYYAGQQKKGLAMLDSVIAVLMPPKLGGYGFNELDAFIIASKRKIGVLNSMKRFAETLPLAHRITELLDDYEQHPDKYHDGSPREPKDAVNRADYIHYYRSQAQNFVTAAYAALGECGSMEETFYEIERSVKEVTAREHIARYNALQQQMEAERQRTRANNIHQQAVGIAIIALLALCFAVVVFRKNRDIRRKNRVLAQQLTELYGNARPAAIEHPTLTPEHSATQKDTEAYHAPSPKSNVQSKSIISEDLYHQIRDEVIRLQLYTDPGFGRQSIIKRFHLTKDVASRVFSQGSKHSSISDFITECRLDHARRLLISRPDMSITDIATASGFGLRTTFTRSFKSKHGLTPSEFREQQEQS
ncbi:MAG: AraC family transcriptional regulator [Prevotella sp.]|nr:AraC family transcriptional regulator [Prevotella sp.]